MAISKVGTPNAAAVATSGSVSPTWSATQPRTAGHLLVARVCAEAGTSAAAIANTGGTWTKVDEGSATGAKAAIFYRVATGGDAAPTFTSTVSGTGPRMWAYLEELSGQDATTPIDTYGHAQGTTLQTLAVATSGNVTKATNLVMGAHGEYRSGTQATTFAPGGSFSKITAAADESTVNAHNGADEWATPTAGAAASETVTWSRTGSFTASVLVVIRAAAVTQTGTVAVSPVATVAAAGGLAQSAAGPAVAVTATVAAAGAVVPAGSVQVTATQGGSTNAGLLLRVRVLTAAAATQNGQHGNQSGVAAHSVTFTPTVLGSYVYGAVINDYAGGPIAADSGTTMVDNVVDVGHSCYYGSFRSTAATTSLTSTTYGSPSSYDGGAAAAEMLPAVPGTPPVEDGSSPNPASTTSATSVQSDPFTPPAGSLVVAMVASQGGAAQVTMTVAGGTLTWTEVDAGNIAGHDYAGVWIAQVPAKAGDAAVAVTAAVVADGQVVTAGATLVQYGETAWNTTGAKSITGLNWLAGDLIIVAACNANGAGVIGAPTSAGLTFTDQGAIGAVSSNCRADTWVATAAADGSAQSVASTGSGSYQWGMACWIFRSHGGAGTRAAPAPSSAKSVSLARAGDHSRVILISGDYVAADPAGYSFVPPLGSEGHDREHLRMTGEYTVYVADWPNQGLAGTDSYGTSGETSAGPFTTIALEVKQGGGPQTWSGDVSAGASAAVSAAGTVTGSSAGPAAAVAVTVTAGGQVTRPAAGPAVTATAGVTASAAVSGGAAGPAVSVTAAVAADGSVGTAPKTGDAAVLVSAGVTAAGALVTGAGGPAVTATAGVTAAGSVTRPAAGPSLTVTAAVTAAGSVTRPGAAAVAASAGVSASGQLTTAGQATVGLSVTVGVSGAVGTVASPVIITAAATAAGQLTAQAAGPAVTVAAAVACDGQVGAAPKTGDAAVPLTAAATAAGQVSRPAAAQPVSVTVTVSAAATVTRPGAATVAVTATVTAAGLAGTPAQPVTATAVVAATGLVARAGAVAAVVAAAAAAAGQVTAAGQAAVAAAAVITAEGEQVIPVVFGTAVSGGAPLTRARGGGGAAQSATAGGDKTGAIAVTSRRP